MSKLTFSFTIAVLLFTFGAARAATEEMAPDESATRKQIDQLIKKYQDDKKKATLGLIEEAISLSISFGAPTWNQGDHASCCRFYTRTVQSLCTAFAAESSATEEARHSLTDLKTALERTGNSTDLDRNAWSLRFAFDKNHVACAVQASHAESLIALYDQYFRMSQFVEAQDAGQSAVVLLQELDGQALESIPAGARYAPLALSNAYFAQKRYSEAAGAVLLGLKYFPDWPGVKFDLRGLHHDPEEYEQIMTDLEGKARKESVDAALPFLLGYEYYFTGKKAAAKEQFQRTLQLDAQHAGAKVFLKKLEGTPEMPANPPEPAELPVVKPKNGVL